MAADTNALLILCADRIVDGTGRPALEKGFVALRQDRIREVGLSEALSKHLPESVRRLEFPGCTILPGFVDSHSHLTFSAGLAPLKDLQGETDGRLILGHRRRARSPARGRDDRTRPRRARTHDARPPRRPGLRADARASACSSPAGQSPAPTGTATSSAGSPGVSSR